jgi:hypothetical protein
MTFPYAALVGLAAKASSGIGNQISRAYRGGTPELDREKERIQQQYLDAVARKHGYNVNYAGTMDSNPVTGPTGLGLGNQAGLGAAIQALGGIGGGDDKAPTAEDIQKSDFFKHSGDYGDIAAAEEAGGGGGAGGGIIQDDEPQWLKNAGKDPTERFSVLGDYRTRPYSVLDEDDPLKDPWRRL